MTLELLNQNPPSSVEHSDKMWLADRVAEIERGIDSTGAVLENWTEGRNLSRYFPGQTAAEYLKATVKTRYRAAVRYYLDNTDLSHRQIAERTGVGPRTVDRIADSTASIDAVERPTRLLGGDGKYRPARVTRTVTAEILESEEPEEPESDLLPESAYVPHQPGPWNAAWERLVDAALDLDDLLNKRQLIVADHTYAEWDRIDGQVNIVLRTLEMFQRREKAALAATSPEGGAG